MHLSNINGSQPNMIKASDIGILAIEIYFPRNCIKQSDLEKFDNVSTGKYVVGLGQEVMSFTAECEDIYSICLTVVQNLIEKYEGIDFKDIGRLEVGTETIIDKSKSIKSVLMQLFESSGNFDVEGVDNINACYGATAALFNTINWIHSESWDGRYGLVVGGDIAVYAEGNARPTGGAGAVAILLGPGAPIIVNPIHSTFCKNLYDFYKPRMESEYPIVDGQLSIQCYLQALDYCYTNYNFKTSLPILKDVSPEKVTRSLDDLNFVCFHSPYCKLVEKSFSRLRYLDLQARFLLNSHNFPIELSHLIPHMNKSRETTYFDRILEKDMMTSSRSEFVKKTLPTLNIAKNIGNMYTPSLYGSLLSLLGHIRELVMDVKKEEAVNGYTNGCEMNGNCLNAIDTASGDDNLVKFPLEIGMFSYGSGAIATFFTLTIKKLPKYLSNFQERLNHRIFVDPTTFTTTLKEREAAHLIVPFEPKIDVEKQLFPGTFYLVNIDEKYRRSYKRIPPSQN